MHKTQFNSNETKVMVDINGLQDMLSCGKTTANQIGEKAGAVIKFGRRKLYNVFKITSYLNELAEKNA